MIKIDPEFSALIPPLTAEEFSQLEQNIIKDGCIDPLIVWERLLTPIDGDYQGIVGVCKDDNCSYRETGVPAELWIYEDGRWVCPECGYGVAPEEQETILIDGHNRIKICEKHGIPFNIHSLTLDNREQAADWIDKNQAGRRNLTPEQMSLLRGRRYNRLKRQGERTDLTLGQNVQKLTTSEELAYQHGVSEKTIRRDAQFANDVEKLKAVVPDIEQKIIDSESKITKQEITIAAKLSESYPDAAASIVNHRAIGTGENEWYTPVEYIESVKEVLGQIDLDPASSEIAQESICATKFYTIEDDGLSMDWEGKVFLNPPYSQPHIKNFIQKAVEEISAGNVKEIIVLTHNYTDTSWFHQIAGISDAICFTRGRIAFVNPEGKKAAPTQGQAFFYCGLNAETFVEVFQDHGIVLKRCHDV